MDALHDWRQPALPSVDEPDREFKARVRTHYDRLAARRDRWYRRNRRYHDYLEHALRALVAPGQSVLELGCGTGNLLNALQPARGVGIDLSPAMVDLSRQKYPKLRFEVQDAEAIDHAALSTSGAAYDAALSTSGAAYDAAHSTSGAAYDAALSTSKAAHGDEPFDVIVASDLIGELLDVTAMLERLHALSSPETRVILTFHNPALEGMLRAAQRLGLTMPPARQNWIGPQDIVGLLELSDFTVELAQTGLLLPALLPRLDRVADLVPAGTPLLGYLNAVNIVVARPQRPRPLFRPLSCSVIVPCRNEVGNIEAAVGRMPSMGSHTEIVFVDGASSDGTCERIEEMQRRFAGLRDIRLIHQVPGPQLVPQRPVAPDAPVAMLRLGKGDAVRKGFEAARGDVLLILDADLTVPPEDLPRFFDAIAGGKAEFVNGNRLLYPMEERAMKFVNYLGNKLFSSLFTWMLGQRIRDTLCGTKALRREAYVRIAAGRSYFGDFDPFGDFDLLFGAARLGLRIVDVPVRYRRRRKGVTKVRVVRHGLLLIAMSLVAFRKFKLNEWIRVWR